MFGGRVEVGDESSFERFEGRVAGSIGAGAGRRSRRAVHNGIEHGTGQHACGAARTGNYAGWWGYGIDELGEPSFAGNGTGWNEYANHRVECAFSDTDGSCIANSSGGATGARNHAFGRRHAGDQACAGNHAGGRRYGGYGDGCEAGEGG